MASEPMQEHHTDYQQDVNQSAGNMKREETNQRTSRMAVSCQRNATGSEVVALPLKPTNW
jgi:hypothetical protein